MNIKEKIRKSLIPQWKVAKKIGVCEQTMVKWLRNPEELGIDKLERIEKALKELQREAKS